MKLLSGADIASFVQERQAKQVRALRQAHHIFPRLAIILSTDDPASERYVALKKRYGEEILVETVIEKVATVDEALAVIARHNADPLTHGIIVQVPIRDPERTDEVLQSVAPEKDVDGLGSYEFFDPATPTAIMWLLAGYNIEPRGKKVVVIGGQGRLVGAPLVRMLESTGVEAVVPTRDDNLAVACEGADIIITATGSPGLVTSSIIPQNAVVIDAGTSSESGVLKGDVDQSVYETRDDLKITPQKGGVGPLTVTALFDAVIQAGRRLAEKQDSL